jgi:TPR repeat protein
VNFTRTAELFQLAADSEDAKGANALGTCLEEDQAVEANMKGAVSYNRKAIAKHHIFGMNNFRRCLEYEKGIDENCRRAAQYYPIAANLNNADTEKHWDLS